MRAILPALALFAVLTTAGSGLALIESVGMAVSFAEASADDALAGDTDSLRRRGEAFATYQTAGPVAMAQAAAADPAGFASAVAATGAQEVGDVTLDDTAVEVSSDLVGNALATAQAAAQAAQDILGMELQYPDTVFEQLLRYLPA